MSENSSHDTHPFVPAAQKIPQTSLHGGGGVHPVPNPRHNSIYSASNESSSGDVVMNGISVGEQGHHYHYPSAPGSTPRTAYPNGASNNATSHSKWSGSYYQVNQYANHHSDPDHTRHITSPIVSPHGGAQYPQVAHAWDQTRPIQRSQLSLQDQTYPPNRTIYNNPSYGRPPHHPVEPTATAPSPPNPYPSSPRTPQATGTSQLPPANGLVVQSGHKQPLTSIGPVSSMNGNIHQQELQEQRREYQQNPHIDNHQQHHQGSNQGTFVESLHESPARYSPLQTNRLLNTGGARRLSGMEMRVDGRDRTTPHPFAATASTNSQPNYFYNSSPLSPGSKIGHSLNEALHPGRYQYNGAQSGGFRYEGNKGVIERANSEEQHSYLTGSESQFSGLQRPGPMEVQKTSLQNISNGHQEYIKNQHHDDTDEEDGIKRESISRTASASVSPTATRSMLPGPGARRDSIDSNASAGSGKEGNKKRGGPVFTDHNGRQYYEEDVVPPGVEVPAGWQLGAGKKCLNKLLPCFKDGLPVFPEWGLTSAGKARQRLPKACASCRTKKIKCVESDQDDTKCAHCHKMRIACSQDDEEKPARKNSKKISDKKKKKDGTMDQEVAVGSSASPGVLPLNGGQGNFGPPKKRKASDDGQKSGGVFLKRGKSSRDSSFSMEPIEEKTDVMNNSVETAKLTALRHHHQLQTQAPIQSQKRLTFATEHTSATSMNVTDEGRAPRSFSSRVLAEQYPPGGYVGIPPVSGATPSSFTSASPTSDHPVIYGANNSYSSSSKALSATPTMKTPPLPSYVPLPMGEDPRNSKFPPPAVVNHLVEMYFKYVYSQTYAFLHKQTFIETLDKQPAVLVVSLCTVAARFSQECSHMEETLAVQARQLIFDNYDRYCLEVVQSMIHMGLHDFGSSKGDKAWMFCGMAVRMGTALNLNLENGRAKIKLQCPIARESARRTFWSYYLMDRFNSYGVARPFLTQDHDCHVQLPCNQPSFRDGKTVVTEHLLGPNPAKPDVGTIHMGAMAFLVRVVGIWGNILKQIHLSGFDKGKDKEAEFQALIEQLETWRKFLPSGLEYSNENLAGQIKVGTAGAFVTMHVMWHTAMAYVHRYVRVITKEEVTDKTGQSILDESIITSIRKTFVHADAVLLIMSHVQQRRKEAKELGETEVIVNAPFLGQAISDACDISIIRALELKGDPSNAMDQKERIHIGLIWLKELRGYWKPLEGMYRKLRKSYRELDKQLAHTQSGRLNNIIPSPDSGNGSEMIADYPMFQFPIDPATYDLHPDMGMGHHLSAPESLESQQWLCIPESYYEAAFAGTSSLSLYGIAEAEGGFPQLYMDQHMLRGDMGMTTSLAPDPGVSYQSAILDSTQIPLMSHQFNQLRQNSDADDSDNEDEDDEKDEVDDDGDEHSMTSSKKRVKTKSHLSTLYFHPNAVLDGKLDSSGSESSGLESRRQSEAAQKPEHNRMDVLNLLVSANVTQYVRRAVESRNESDLGTGRQGIMVPNDGILKGEVNTDNSKDQGPNN